MKSNTAQRNVEPYVDSAVIGVVHGMLGIAEQLILASREQEMKRLADQRARAVQLITDAIFEGRRVGRDEIDRFAYGAYLTQQQLADKLGIPLTFLKAGLKRWYHFF
jgi:hypothetical protein